MQPITYSLKNQQRRSDQFYRDLSDFTDVVVKKILSKSGALIAEFEQVAGMGEVSPKRNSVEHGFDLLVLGVLWRVYASQAERLARGPRQMLERLVETRRKSQLLKPMADFLRGLISGVALFSRRDMRNPPRPSLQNLEKLIGWLDAVGEFKEEVRRMQAWYSFLATKNEAQQQEALQEAAGLAEWFEENSLAVLGKYTPNVEPFLKGRHSRYRWREDYIFTGRKQVEYHLNMVGMEIMNRGFRAGFLKADRKFIFVPPCMSAPQDGKCQATATPYGEHCAGCTPTCQVHQVTKLGEKYGIQVFMIPDSFSPLASSNGQGLADIRLGVVGVSCPLTIISGGYEMKRMGIPAQGVLLDHCGCSWHWDPGKGIVTEINIKQLARILGEEENAD